MSERDSSSLPHELRRSLQDRSPAALRHAERVWNALGDAVDERPPAISTDEAWDAVAARIGSAPADAPGPRRYADRRSHRSKLRRRRFTVAAVAAACVILFGIGWIFTPVTITTPPGEQQVIRLPDGSAVETNSATTLQRPRLFATVPGWLGGGRRVVLDGEAYFRIVASDEPFFVETNDATVEVLGTEFNVRSRNTPDEAGTAVTLAYGSVRISSKSTIDSVSSARSPTSVVLSKSGDAARVGPMGTITRSVGSENSSLDYALAWRSSGFAAIDRPLRSVLDEMEHRYDLEIFPREGVDLLAPINVFYLRGAEPEQILRDICLSQSCGYRETSRGYALVDGGRASDDSDVLSATPDSSN